MINARRNAIRLRHYSMLALALVGAAASVVLLMPLNSLLTQLVQHLARIPLVWLVPIYLIVLTAGLVPFARNRCSAFFGFGFFRAYPPLWSAAMLGVMLTFLCLRYGPWSTLITRPRRDDFLLLSLASLLAFGLAGMAAHILSPARRTLRVPSTAPPIEITPHTLNQWLDSDDSPIHSPSQDLFQHAAIARRIALRLCFPRERPATIPTFVLLGRRGSGKTSIYNMTRYYCDHPSQLTATGPAHVKPVDTAFGILRSSTSPRMVRCVWLSAWRFADTESLLRGVLRALIDAVHREVDAYALVGLPSAYVHTIASATKLIGTIGALLSSRIDDSDECMQAINSILIAIDIHLVLWVDDLERFSEAATTPSAPVHSLLAILRECTHISFVIAMAEDS